VYWVGVGVCALSTAVSIKSSQSAVDQQRQQWGATTHVWIATTDVQPGRALSASVRRADMPLAMLPTSAVQTVAPAAVARHFIAVGEVIVNADVSASGGPSALLPKDWQAVSIDSTNAGLFAPGDSAAVFAFGQTLVDNAIVVAVGEGVVVVGISGEVAARVADAAQQRLATVALSANPPAPRSGP
jgi:hypothetical protein